MREALFNVLRGSVQGCAVLDLYAGSGSLGIEALSRGAARVVFVEMGHAAAAVIGENLSILGARDPQIAQIVQRPIDRSIDLLRSMGPFDLCLIDPPFAAVRDGSALRTIERVASSGIVGPDSTLILEYPSDQPEPVFEALALEELRVYGDTRLAFLRPKEPLGHNGLGEET